MTKGEKLFLQEECERKYIRVMEYRIQFQMIHQYNRYEEFWEKLKRDSEYLLLLGEFNAVSKMLTDFKLNDLYIDNPDHPLSVHALKVRDSFWEMFD